MLWPEFQAMLVAVDPAIDKWKSVSTGNYTTWRPYEIGGMAGDNGPAEHKANVQIDRFTTDDPDSIEPQITAALRTRDAEIAFRHIIDYERDTGYIHHIWDCEVLISG